MVEKKEVKRVLKFAKKILLKETLKKFKKVKSLDEKYEAIKYALKFRMEFKFEHLKEIASEKKKEDKDVFFIEAKLSLLRNKIMLFNATHHKEDFINVIKLFKEVDKELKHV